MATKNIFRTLFSPGSMVANSTVVGDNTVGVIKGTVPIFWPRNEAGVFGQDKKVIGFDVVLSDGSTNRVTDLNTFSVKGVTIKLTGIMSREEQLITITNTGELAVQFINVELEQPSWSLRSFPEVEQRVRELEEVIGSGTGGFTPGDAVADPVATTSQAVTAPAAGADAAALVTWATNMTTQFNAVRSTNSSIFTAVKNLLTSLETAGIIKP